MVEKDTEGHNEVCIKLGDTLFVLVQAEVERPLLGDHVAFSVSKSSYSCMRKDSGNLIIRTKWLAKIPHSTSQTTTTMYSNLNVSD